MLLDRQIRSIQREEDKVKFSLKEAAKKGVFVILIKIKSDVLILPPPLSE